MQQKLSKKESIKLNENIKIYLKRGDASWAYFPLAYSILTGISIGIIQVVDILRWQLKVFLILLISVIAGYLCFFNKEFRNFIVGFFNKSKDFIEEYEVKS